MDAAALLALYDQEQRVEVEFPGMRREVVEGTIRQIDLAGRRSCVIYFRLSDIPVEDAIRREISHFETLGHDFEWKVYAHDSPADLRELLEARGFEAEATEAVLVLDLERPPSSWPAAEGHEVTRITEPGQIRDVVSLQEKVWGEDQSWLHRRLADDLRRVPEQLGVYVAYVDAMAVCAGWIYFTPASQFASLWGGSTLPGYRQRGFYTALLAARISEARRRGVRFLTIDALPTSQPVAEKFGFEVLTHATGCLWRKKR